MTMPANMMSTKMPRMGCSPPRGQPVAPRLWHGIGARLTRRERSLERVRWIAVAPQTPADDERDREAYNREEKRTHPSDLPVFHSEPEAARSLRLAGHSKFNSFP